MVSSNALTSSNTSIALASVMKRLIVAAYLVSANEITTCAACPLSATSNPSRADQDSGEGATMTFLGNLELEPPVCAGWASAGWICDGWATASSFRTRGFASGTPEAACNRHEEGHGSAVLPLRGSRPPPAATAQGLGLCGLPQLLGYELCLKALTAGVCAAKTGGSVMMQGRCAPPRAGTP